MATATLRPNATLQAPSSVTQGGAAGATAHQVTAHDGDDSFYTDSGGSESPVQVELGTFTLPAGAVTKSARVWHRSRRSSSEPFTLNVLGALSPLGEAVAVTSIVTAPGAFTTHTGAWTPISYSQAQIDSSTITTYRSVGGTYQVADLGLDFMYVTKPIVSLNAITDPWTTSTLVSIGWTYTNLDSDGGSQTHYRAWVTNDSGGATVYDSGVVASAAASANVGPLPAGNYTIHLQIAQTVNGTLHWSDEDNQVGVTMNVADAEVYFITCRADSERGRLLVEANVSESDYANITGPLYMEWERSDDQWETWVPVRNGTVVDSTTPRDTVAWNLTAAGQYFSTPDRSGIDNTGDLSLVAHIAPVDWTPASNQQILGKWHTAGQLSYRLVLRTTGALAFEYTTDGTTVNTRVSTATTLSSNLTGAWKWVAATLDAVDTTNHSVRFWTSDDGVIWTQYGTTVTTAGNVTMFSGTSILTVGAASGGLIGMVRRAKISGGTLPASGLPSTGLDAEWWAVPTYPYTDGWTGFAWSMVGNPTLEVLWADDLPYPPRGTFIADYEAPPGTFVTYRARPIFYSSGLPVIGGYYFADSQCRWLLDTDGTGCALIGLHAPFEPSLNAKFQVMMNGVPSVDTDMRQGIFSVLGRSDRVASSDVRLSGTGTINLITTTLEEAASLRALLEQPVLFLASPAEWGWTERYIAPGRVREQRPGLIGAQPVVEWTIEFTNVGAPVGNV